MRPAPGHGARAVGKKAKKKPEATSAGEAPVPDPGEGATLAQPEGAPGPAEGAAGPPALSAAPLPLDGLPAPDLGAFFELTFPDQRLLALGEIFPLVLLPKQILQHSQGIFQQDFKTIIFI